MYYLVSGTGDGSFEWVIEADSEEFARQNAMKDLSADDKITSIKALSVDECIELGYKELSNEIKVADIDEMKLGKLKHYLNLLTQAKTEEEFNEILNNVKEKE